MEFKTKEDRFRRVRCIDPKNNTVKMIPAHAVAECVAAYGLIVQDFPEKKEEKKEPKKVEWEYPESAPEALQIEHPIQEEKPKKGKK
jgi:hypothetical protein